MLKNKFNLSSILFVLLVSVLIITGANYVGATSFFPETISVIAGICNDNSEFGAYWSYDNESHPEYGGDCYDGGTTNCIYRYTPVYNEEMQITGYNVELDCS